MEQRYFTPSGRTFKVISPDNLSRTKIDPHLLRVIGGVVTSIDGSICFVKLNYVDRRIPTQLLEHGNEIQIKTPYYCPVESWGKFPHFIWNQTNSQKKFGKGDAITLQIVVNENDTSWTAHRWTTTDEYLRVLKGPQSPQQKKPQLKIVPFEPSDTATYRVTFKKGPLQGVEVTGKVEALIKFCYDNLKTALSGWPSAEWKKHTSKTFESCEPPRFEKNPMLESALKKGA